MKVGGGILLIVVGITTALPLEINQFPLVDEIPDEVRIKRKANNHEISVGVSHSSSSGTSGSIGYTYRFKRSPPEELSIVPAAGNIEEYIREKRGTERTWGENNDRPYGRKGYLSSSRFRREIKETFEKGRDQTPLVVETQDDTRVKRDEKNHEIGVQVSHGSSSGTSASINYAYKFKRSLPEPQDLVPVVDELEENTRAVSSTDNHGASNGSIRVRRDENSDGRDKNNEIQVHVSHGGEGGTQGMIIYRRRFRRESPVEVAEDIDQTPLLDETPGETRVKREEKNNEIDVPKIDENGN